MKKFFYLYIVSSVFLMISCNSFLEEHPKGFISPDDFYKTKEHAEAGVNAIYSLLTGDGAYGALYVISEFPTDQGIVGYPGNPTFMSMQNMTFDAANSTFENLWRTFYDGINKANMAIERIPEISEMRDEAKNELVAEAKFLRALFYFNLVRWFGDIPLIETPTENLSGLQIPREDKLKVYYLIEQDLNFACNNLPNEPREIGRSSKIAAKVLLGKVFITMAGKPLNQSDRWSLAKDVLGEVIISNPKDYIFSDYSLMWKEENENSLEFIFSVQYDGKNINTWLPRRFAPRSSNIQAATSYGEIAPSEIFLRSFEKEDLRLKLFKTEYPLYNSDQIVQFDKPYCFKFWDECDGGLSGINFPILRCSDALLLYAEASNEVAFGDQKAIDCLNAIRTRVNLPIFNKEQLNQSSFRQAVLDERNHELCFEGHRWFDLIRTGNFISTLENIGKKVEDTHLFFPIPQRDMDINHELIQNPGY